MKDLFIYLLTYFSKEVQERWIQKQWDKKEDSAILDSFTDATEWIDLSIGIMEMPALIEIAEDCIRRLEVYILPQMRKRKLI